MDQRPQLPPQVLAALARDDLGPKTLGLVYSFTFLALICVALRFFSRIKFTKMLGLEDYFIGISAVRMILQVKGTNRRLLKRAPGLLYPLGRLPDQTGAGGRWQAHSARPFAWNYREPESESNLLYSFH
jgi:hypothetical protein